VRRRTRPVGRPRRQPGGCDGRAGREGSQDAVGAVDAGEALNPWRGTNRSYLTESRRSEQRRGTLSAPPWFVFSSSDEIRNPKLEIRNSTETTWLRLFRISRAAGSIHVRIGAEVLEDFLALLLVDHQIDALAAVALLEALLAAHEEG